MATCFQPTTHRLGAAPAEPVAGALPALAAPKRILVVDDDDALRRFCAIVLEQAGYDVSTAADGLLAWNALQNEPYDLLITDIQMPRLNGLELVTRVRRAGGRLPVLIVSGSLNQLEPCDLNRLEWIEVLQKPTSVSELLRVVAYALARPVRAEADPARFDPLASRDRSPLKTSWIAGPGCHTSCCQP